MRARNKMFLLSVAFLGASGLASAQGSAMDMELKCLRGDDALKHSAAQTVSCVHNAYTSGDETEKGRKFAAFMLDGTARGVLEQKEAGHLTEKRARVVLASVPASVYSAFKEWVSDSERHAAEVEIAVHALEAQEEALRSAQAALQRMQEDLWC
jgi:hypothetical protein